MKNLYIKYENFILTVFYTLFLVIFIALRYDFYYALNDDVMMKDILAGIYTGTPESRNIQMLYPLSLIISLFYRIIPIIPWYGIFLCICQFMVVYLIALRSLNFCKNIIKKVLFLLFFYLIIFATMLEHLVFIQYTITSAMLTTAAVFYFITSEVKDNVTAFIKVNVPSFILLFIAFLLRPWMLLLLLPIICVAGIFKWSQEEIVFSKPNFFKYFSIFSLLILILLISQAADMLATSSPEWKKFNRFFSNRTALYDFQSIPEYDTNVTFYNSINLSKAEVKLLENLNFGLSEKIDEVIVGEVARYANEKRNENHSFKERFNKQFQLYFYNMTHGGEFGDYPYNSLVLLGYAALLGLGIFYNRLSRIVMQLFLMAGVRSGLWLFILMGERHPARISHSLYFIEMGILLAMFFTEMLKAVEGEKTEKSIKSLINKTFPMLIITVALLIATGNITKMINITDIEFSERENRNQSLILLKEYSYSHPDNFYFIDVYSTVTYSEKLLAKTGKSPANYDIMGGWVVKSPLYHKKIDKLFGTGTTMFDALLYDNVYFINDLKWNTAWLPDYYHEQGFMVTLEKVDAITDNLEVYKLR